MKPLVTERNRILSTKDYGLFKYKIHRLNERKLAIIIDEMSIKNISKDTAIIVDAEFNIIDGRYRFEANKKLNAPIYYKVAEVANKLDLMKASSLSTKPTNYEYVLMHQDKLAYRKVLEWANILPYSFEDIICILNYSYLVHQNRHYSNIFRNGEMEYTKEDDFKLNKYKEFIAAFSDKYPDLRLDISQVESCLDLSSYEVGIAMTLIEGLVYLNEFLTLKKDGHPLYQDFGNYYDEAIACISYVENDNKFTSKLSRALELTPWGEPYRPLLYRLHKLNVKL